MPLLMIQTYETFKRQCLRVFRACFITYPLWNRRHCPICGLFEWRLLAFIAGNEGVCFFNAVEVNIFYQSSSKHRQDFYPQPFRF